MRLGFLGLQKDKESNLGDPGVRKYDSEIGRFLAIDPKMDKYVEWNPYQYSMNNPIAVLDKDGKDIIVLYDKDGANGAGHTALLIGNDEMGWGLFSKNGTKENYHIWGNTELNFQDYGQNNDSKITNETNRDAYFKDLNEFFGKNKVYDKYFRIPTNNKQDNLAMEGAMEEILEDYNFYTNSCLDVVSNGLKKANLPYLPKLPNPFFNNNFDFEFTLNNKAPKFYFFQLHETYIDNYIK